MWPETDLTCVVILGKDSGNLLLNNIHHPTYETLLLK